MSYSSYTYSAYHKSLGQYDELEKIQQNISWDVKVDPPVDMDIINRFQSEFVIVAKRVRIEWTNPPIDYVIYRNGVISDIQFNGWTFQPFVRADHVWDNGYFYKSKCLSPTGKLIEFNLKYSMNNILDMFNYISKFDSDTAEFLIPLQVKLKRIIPIEIPELLEILNQIKNKIEQENDQFASVELKKTFNDYLDRLQDKIRYTKYTID